VTISNWEQYKEYTKFSPGVVAKHGGKFMARGGEMATLEGPVEGNRIVILEFPSLEKAKKFYHSPEYQTAKKLREGASTVSFVALTGV
jgi:uncharacterized protein (DUF1330 family)